MKNGYTTTTMTSSRVWTRKELEAEILMEVRELSKRKWYQERKWLLNRIFSLSRELELLTPSK